MQDTEAQLSVIYRDITGFLKNRNYAAYEVNSLFKGPWGGLLFLFYYERYIAGSAMQSVKLLEELYETFDPNTATAGYNYCMGCTGPYWLLHHLDKHKFIDVDIEDLSDSFINTATHAGKEYCRLRDFDFFHGSTGISHFLVGFAHREDVRAYMTTYVAALMEIGEKTALGRSMPILFRTNPPTDVPLDAFGLAHGICSVLLILLKIHRAGISPDTCKQLVYESIEFMLNHKNKLPADSVLSYYPAFPGGGSAYSRLSWCYGDLNVAISLWHCGQYFGENAWTQEAIEIMHHSTYRNTMETAGAVDACICHGTAGIAAIYHRFWHETQQTEFYNASRLWHNKTMELITADRTGTSPGTKVWISFEKKWEYCCDLLEGGAGVGLSLLSHLLQTTLPWDECLLLS